jgi:hypothetical protein
MTLTYTGNTAVLASYKVGIYTIAPSPALVPQNRCITKNISANTFQISRLDPHNPRKQALTQV